MLIILEIKFNCTSIDAACRVNLINCQLCAVLNGQAIYSRAPGSGSDTANLNHAACCRVIRCSCLVCRGCLGSLSGPCCAGTAACC